ncbi:MAG: rod shape-determining protein RodA [Richelia sp. RM2_1_2]|nr:rod shape-determining protein RodA [Richelia sp. SM1_7_0]NJN08442.1 rod shape-determining protein RodA [Richelia sp. RM1_1_1]NJO27024.1 rod shape-determining protein RodA [Richelia sp. SL_2_1]NJO60212.1 rod shape-determining protein RodA [Richelia sp. RM2_1_2]
MLLKKSRYSRNRNPWQNLFKPWQQIDLLLFLLPIAITIFGGFMILSTELNQGNTDSKWPVHLILAGVGVFLALLIARTRYENLQRLHWITYTLTNVSLIAVMVVGVAAKGAQRWISVFGFNIQPSEFAKIGVIITLAALLHKRTADTLPNFFRTLAVTAVPWALVFLQPDLATSLVFGAIVLAMLYWANANPGWLILLVSPVVAAILFSIPWPWAEPMIVSKELFFTPLGLIWSITMGLVGWYTLPGKRFGLGGIGALALNLLGGEIGIFAWNHVLKEYQKGRITSFLNPELDPLGTGYHLIQSRIAIGAGTWFGWGPFNGPMTQLNFVPEQHTDFIFSAVGEQFGFIGCLVLLLGFCLVCQRLLYVASTAKDNFGSLLAIGVLAKIVFQMVVNIGMTIGLAPVAGIPLPFMSYGGSAMLANFIGIGLVESVANFRILKKY